MRRAAPTVTGLVVAALAAATLATGPATTPPSPVELASVGIDADALGLRHGDAVHRVEARGCGSRSSGSAFALDPYHLVTNRHVVEMDTAPRVVSRDGFVREGRVIGWRNQPDVAVIAVDRPVHTTLEWAETAGLREGQPLAALGYPMPTFDFAVTPAAIVSFQRDGHRRTVIRAAGALDGGNSGGPALAADGRVAGVVTRMALDEGYQLVPLVDTAERMGRAVEHIIANPGVVEPRCGTSRTTVPTASGPRRTADIAGASTGRATVSMLRGLCEDGSGDACTRLRQVAPTCGSDDDGRDGDECG